MSLFSISGQVRFSRDQPTPPCTRGLRSWFLILSGIALERALVSLHLHLHLHLHLALAFRLLTIWALASVSHSLHTYAHVHALAEGILFFLMRLVAGTEERRTVALCDGRVCVARASCVGSDNG